VASQIFLACLVAVFAALSVVGIITTFNITLHVLLGNSSFDIRSRITLGMLSPVSIIYSAMSLYLVQRMGWVKLLVFSAMGCSPSLLAKAVLIDASRGTIKINTQPVSENNFLQVIVGLDLACYPLSFSMVRWAELILQ
jgi:hypothetical protein